MQNFEEISSGMSTFWQTLMQKYIQQNLGLQEQRLNLKRFISDKIELSKAKMMSDCETTTKCNEAADTKSLCSDCSSDSGSLGGVEGKEVGEGSGFNIEERQIDDDDFLKEISSMSSIDSADVDYVRKLRQLVDNEKALKKKIEQLEGREQTYKEILNKADEKWAQLEESYKKRLLDVGKVGDETRVKFEELSEKLMAENARLSDEVKDVKAEMKECIRQAQEPLNKQIDVERRRCERLENQLNDSLTQAPTKSSDLKQGIKDLKQQLVYTVEHINELSINKDRQLWLAMQAKYKELKRDEADKKLAPGNTLGHLSEALNIMKL